jgi:rhodanese-related sulfurtransferase
VNENKVQKNGSRHCAAIRKILAEALVVAVLGAAFALAANQISPRGLLLTSNYFPGGTNNSVRPVATPNNAGTNSVPLTPEQVAIQNMKEKGLQTIDGSQALQFFQDPRRQQDIVVFVDARDDSHYHEGHIPGAYQIDPYNRDKYLEAALPVCLKAEQIVVYCNGGECDDSESIALLLRDDIGIVNQKIFVYTGGITEWNAKKLPMETGERNSGTLRDNSK